MKTSDINRGGRVRLDEESVLARYAEWHSRLKGRPVAALGPETRNAMLFVADEVLIDGNDQDLASELIKRYGAKVIDVAPLPAPPNGFPKDRHMEPEKLPQLMRLRFTAQHIEGMDVLLDQAVEGMYENDQELTITSEVGATVAAIAARHGLEGRAIGLNFFGQKLAMPLSTATEGALPGIGSNPFTWQPFTGRTRIVESWQLVDSIKQMRGNSLTMVGILDQGFWLDNNGIPMVSPTQSVSDFGGSFIQINLQNEGQSAGGTDEDGGWHGNAVASTATAVVNNSAGAAGSGGTVATPVFFKTDFSIDQILYCVKICAAWGIDVLNMSFKIQMAELFFPTSSWNKTFQFAFENNVIMIAAAGNDADDLPDDSNIRPATRTPGVLTIGALDTMDNARGDSNYGSSVSLWAPGTSIPVAPDGSSPNGSFWSQTSFASPIVAGVAAMMRFANPSLSASDILGMLVSTGWNGAGRVTRGLDAFAAVFAAIHQTLPDNNEPNNTQASARDLLPIGGSGNLAPAFNGFTARSSTTDPDYWKFRVDKFSNVIIAVDWYERLCSLYVAVEAEDPDAHGPEDMIRTGNSTSGRTILTGMLPPGNYRIRVGGIGITAYRLLVTRKAAPLPADLFERNDSFTDSPTLLFEASKFSAIGLRTLGPGTFDATLHQERGVAVIIGRGSKLVMNDDYFRLKVPNMGADIFRRPTVSVYDADVPLNVALYNNAQVLIQQWKGVRNVTLYPPAGTCFLKVSGTAPTRYKISVRLTVDPTKVPGPLQEELEIIPKWWGDPGPIRVIEDITHYLVDVNENRGDGEALAFRQPTEPMLLELLDASGSVLRQSESVNGNLFIDTAGIEPGAYVLRASRAEASRGSVVQLKTVPPLR